MNIDITPYQLSDYIYCRNKIIIERNQLDFSEDQNIKIGSALDSDNKKIKISNFEIDGIDLKNKFIIEKKKTLKQKDSIEFQLLYYLFLTKNIYPGFKGKAEDYNGNYFIVDYDENKLLNKLQEMEQFIFDNKFDNSLLNQKKCDNCRFFYFCNC